MHRLARHVDPTATQWLCQSKRAQSMASRHVEQNKRSIARAQERTNSKGNMVRMEHRI